MFIHHGYGGLINELEFSSQRIGERNFGRDNRVMSHWGKELRYSYPDEDFCAVYPGSEGWQKCDPRECPSEVAKDVEPVMMLFRI